MCVLCGVCVCVSVSVVCVLCVCVVCVHVWCVCVVVCVCVCGVCERVDSACASIARGTAHRVREIIHSARNS